ncbi:cupin-like domain-containing protein [Altererythrobacter endophyticus]|uniref:Cupin-like domain-containing protein n=2 Tax=Altericroceibacterium endophyticum TaxID=1808508 RepID=A0A6I4TBL8_9SPHN|nr:cupin-like domain-containing protein [Altericroceibacterium endophyticum]
MADIAPVREIQISGSEELDALLRMQREPFVLRGLVSDWPLVAAGRSSDDEARSYLLAHHRERPVTYSVGKAGSGGRLFYDENMEVDFATGRGWLDDIFDQMAQAGSDQDAGAVYLASIDLHDYFDGLHEANHVDLGERKLMSSLWVSSRSRVAAHSDFPDNLACVVAGKRRFILFPPDQFGNLYPGPLDNTPAGRPISMVDFHNVDFERFPRFAEALEQAQMVELEPGDALYVPSMWWHHVESLSSFNAMINYWWRDSGRWHDQPQNALFMALLTIRDLPPEEREHWRAQFDHYIFDPDPELAAHVPASARGILDPLTDDTAMRLRSFLLRQLGR